MQRLIGRPRTNGITDGEVQAAAIPIWWRGSSISEISGACSVDCIVIGKNLIYWNPELFFYEFYLKVKEYEFFSFDNNFYKVFFDNKHDY